jgi:hypothetical protein
VRLRAVSSSTCPRSTSVTITAADSKYRCVCATPASAIRLASTAAPTPSAISVNMFGRRATIESQPRAKSGSAAQPSTGAASASCSQPMAGVPMRRSSAWPASMSPMLRSNSTALNAAATRVRRSMSARSAAKGSSALGPSGSSAMPQIGHVPGPTWRTSGCIGHV